jgi:predicted DsbA family dithiol-disulfide isomerase
MFPSEKLAGMAAYMKRFAAQFGIDDFRQRERIPNTRRALALAEVARDERKLEPFRVRAMDAHWRDGMDLEKDSDLAAIAREAGLAENAVERSRTATILARVDDAREEANEMGVQGIPTFLIDNLGLSGCQPYAMFEQFAIEAGVPRRGGQPDHDES